jgi:hypothetical protein
MGFRFETIESVSVDLKKENEALKKELQEIKAGNTTAKRSRKTKTDKE